MADLARYVRPAEQPEVFGLSTLDTVSCALGGAIILMILMASFIERGAPVKVSAHRGILGENENPSDDDAGVGQEGGSALSSIATLFLDFDGTDVAIAGVHAPGEHADCGGLRVSHLDPSRIASSRDPPADRLAFIVWDDGSCPSFAVEPQYTSTPPPCTMTLVSGAHFDVKRFPRCPGRIRLRKGGRYVYVLQRPAW